MDSEEWVEKALTGRLNSEEDRPAAPRLSSFDNNVNTHIEKPDGSTFVQLQNEDEYQPSELVANLPGMPGTIDVSRFKERIAGGVSGGGSQGSSPSAWAEYDEFCEVRGDFGDTPLYRRENNLPAISLRNDWATLIKKTKIILTNRAQTRWNKMSPQLDQPQPVPLFSQPKRQTRAQQAWRRVSAPIVTKAAEVNRKAKKKVYDYLFAWLLD